MSFLLINIDEFLFIKRKQTTVMKSFSLFLLLDLSLNQRNLFACLCSTYLELHIFIFSIIHYSLPRSYGEADTDRRVPSFELSRL